MTTADEATIAAKLKQDIETAANFKDNGLEQQFKFYCTKLGIPYNKLSPEELNGIMSALKKSKYWMNAQHRRGKSKLSHGKSKHKK
ncbi:MAG: hypothetical protein K2O18_13510 [Oscillospiraceae bacterium]|nr:hypothetical protein [Oscillospiraceae bacterium]